MRRPSFVLRLARREARTGFRRVGLYMASISLGVAALVAIHSFRSDVSRSIQEEAQVLLGADARLSAGRPIPDSVTAFVDSLVAAGSEAARVTTAGSMVLARSSDAVRLLQVRGVEEGYPFYGEVNTVPEGLWGTLGPGRALVDPAVLTQLGAEVGDTLGIGTHDFRIVGTVEDLPTDVSFQTAVGPRVYVSHDALEAAGLLGFGSLARHRLFLTLADEEDRAAVEERYGELLEGAGVSWVTAEEQARNFTTAVDYLGRYLGLIGLGALLLGGIGVASAIHVYVKEKLTSVAVLRCIGARQWTVFRAYLLQAGALGLLGAAVGAVLGVAAQWLLPPLLGGVLPVRVEPRLSLPPVLAGLGIGVWVALLFALIPLLGVKDVPPLRALRRDYEEPRRKSWLRRLDPWRLLAVAALAASVALLSVHEAPEPVEGLLFAGGLAVAVGLLWLTGWAAVRVTRRLVPGGATYTVRQGISNLYRPQNQTVSVVLALGFGVFVVGTVLMVQSSLAEELSFDVVTGRPNILLFDVQPDQVEGVLELLPPEARARAEVDPIVPARIVAINGYGLDELRSDSVGPDPRGWALGREYRHTYRSELTDAEEVVAGSWWDEDDDAGGTARISVEADLSEDLDVVVGDRITWDVSGVRIESRIASLRFVDWERFDTNFFVVFEPGSLDDAPRTSVILTRIDDDERRAGFQRELVERYPNTSALDVTRVQEAVEGILGKVDQAVRFLALFSALAGLLVLAGSLATSRYQRMREGALLKTLGARRAQVGWILFTEYAVLGALSALTGLALATGAGWLVSSRLFEVDFAPSPLAVGSVWLGVTVLTVTMGLLGSRAVLRRPPLPVLREVAE